MQWNIILKSKNNSIIWFVVCLILNYQSGALQDKILAPFHILFWSVGLKNIILKEDYLLNKRSNWNNIKIYI